MKALIAILLLTVTIGVLYALALIGVIPVAKMAAGSPTAMKLLVAMKLAKHPMVAKLAAKDIASPASTQSIDQQAAVDAQKAMVAQQNVALVHQQRAAPARAADAFVPTSDKMVDIYDTMKPDDLARLFGQMSDLAVADALGKMDEGKSGKVLAAMPVDRSARVTMLMNRSAAPQPTAMAQQPLQSGAPSRVTSVP